MDWSQEKIDQYRKAKDNGIFKAKTIGAIDIEEPEFAALAEDIIEIAFEAEYSEYRRKKLFQ